MDQLVGSQSGAKVTSALKPLNLTSGTSQAGLERGLMPALLLPSVSDGSGGAVLVRQGLLVSYEQFLGPQVSLVNPMSESTTIMFLIVSLGKRL